MPTIHDVACTTFTFTCTYGCTVQVIDGQQQPHACAGTAVILDALRDGTWTGEKTWLEVAQHIADALAPEINVRLGDAWETGARDGRSGEKFYGIDD